MSEVVEPHFRQSCPLQHPVEHVEYAVRRDGTSGGGREHVLAAASFPSLISQNFHCVCRQRQNPVGVLRFQRRFHDLAIDPADLPLNPEVTLLQINVLPFQPQQLSTPKTRCQFDVVHLKDAGLLRLPQEKGQLLYGQRLHLSVLQLRQGAAICWVACDQFLILGKIHCRGDHLIDVPHCLGAETLGLFLCLSPFHSAAGEELFVELL